MEKLRVRYQTIELGDIDIHVRTLRDRQQYNDTDGIAEKLGISSALWPLFGVIWPSGMVLANFLLDYQTDNKRILEVGCGIGLSSLLLNHQQADITATDYHPEAGNFLRKNTLLNESRDIPFIQADWKDSNDELGLFDLIIGSDLLYEDPNIQLLSSFIERHSKPTCEVLLADPGRGRHRKFTKRMADLGYTCQEHKLLNTDYLEQSFKGVVLQYQHSG